MKRYAPLGNQVPPVILQATALIVPPRGVGGVVENSDRPDTVLHTEVETAIDPMHTTMGSVAISGPIRNITIGT